MNQMDRREVHHCAQAIAAAAITRAPPFGAAVESYCLEYLALLCCEFTLLRKVNTVNERCLPKRGTVEHPERVRSALERDWKLLWIALRDAHYSPGLLRSRDRMSLITR
jgi:hypothetical protein